MYLKKGRRNEVDFSYMQINIKLSYRLILLTLRAWPGMSALPKITSLQDLVWCLKKEVGDEVEFLCRWASKFYINWCYHFWWTWSGMPKVLEIIIMDYLCSISRKNWVMKLMFYMLINMKVLYKLILLFLMGLARHV